MATEAMIPVVGWMTLLGLPALGYRVHGRAGLAIGTASTALLMLAPELVNMEWNEHSRGWEYVAGAGYIFLASIAGFVLSPILLLMGAKGMAELAQAEVLSRITACLLSLVMVCTIQLMAIRRMSHAAFSLLVLLQIAFLGGLWSLMSYYARVRITDGEGYDGFLEVAAYNGSILVCTIFAFCLFGVVKTPSAKSSSI